MCGPSLGGKAEATPEDDDVTYSELTVGRVGGGAATRISVSEQRAFGAPFDVRTQTRALNRALLAFAPLLAEAIKPRCLRSLRR